MRHFFNAALVLLLGACAASPFALLREASGSVSQNVCSKTFVSGLDPDEVFREHIRPLPGMGMIAWALDYEVDRERREVRTHIAGSYERRSIYRPGRGCTLEYSDVLRPLALQTPEPVPESEPLIVPESAALEEALDLAFEEPGDGPARRTKAVVIMHRGRVMAERYAAGYGVDTPLLSHSVAKSFVNALVGVLQRRGRLSVTRLVDNRSSIRVDNLLRMNAGFDFDERGVGSPASHAWFNLPDTAAFAATRRPVAPPGKQWAYSSLSYVRLSRIVGDVIGGSPQAVRDFAARELFEPLGMRNVTLEFDAQGTLMGAHSMYATARDWARFGLLYLYGGVAAGRRILPEGWVEYSTTPSGDSGYGAGFWLNTTSAAMPGGGMNWGFPGAPGDAFAARGYLGQYVVIVPSADLVIVRFGLSHAHGFEVESVGKLVADVIAAIPAQSRPAETRRPLFGRSAILQP